MCVCVCVCVCVSLSKVIPFKPSLLDTSHVSFTHASLFIFVFVEVSNYPFTLLRVCVWRGGEGGGGGK